MKISALLLVLFSSINFLFSQDQFITAGLSQRTEKSFYHNQNYENIENNYLMLGKELVKNDKLFSIELSYFQSELSINAKKVNSRSDQFSSSGTVIYSSSELSFAYAGVRFSRIKVFFPERAFSINFSGFFHLEANIRQKERNHRQYSVESETVWFPGSESQTSTMSPVSQNYFNAVDLAPVFLTLGISVAPRLSINRFFISPYITGGIAPKWRVHDNMSSSILDRPNRHGGPENINSRTIKNINLVSEFGVSIGYKFERKKG